MVNLAHLAEKKVEELRNMLVTEYNYSEEEANSIKGKNNLLIEIGQNITNKNSTNTEEVTTEEVDLDLLTFEEETKELISKVSEQDVMSLFKPEELVDGKYPTVHGLRRVSKLVLGQVVFSGPKDVWPSTTTDGIGRATVVYGVVFQPKYGSLIEYREVADCWGGNADNFTFSKHTVAIAATRAEARALRKALQLNTISAEEMSGTNTEYIPPVTDGSFNETGKITPVQKNLLKIKCDQLGIDLHKFINRKHFVDPTKYPQIKYKTIDEVEAGVASEMIKEFNEYQNQSDTEIPTQLLKDKK